MIYVNSDQSLAAELILRDNPIEGDCDGVSPSGFLCTLDQDHLSPYHIAEGYDSIAAVWPVV